MCKERKLQRQISIKNILYQQDKCVVHFDLFSAQSNLLSFAPNEYLVNYLCDKDQVKGG